MIKLHYQDDHEELFKLCGGHMTTLVESGAKSASDVFPAEKIAQFYPDDDHFMVHIIAMGDEEHYGPNRNGDSFPKEACEKYHDTFVTNGAFFREHRNRDKATQGIGSIKASAYNPTMGRIELLVWGDKRKAEPEYELVKTGKALSGSMSCYVPWDESSITKKRAASPKDYDDYCKYRMNQYIPEFQKYAFVRNLMPKFFDYSAVQRPADRIAHYISYKYGDNEMAKAASSGQPILGTDWAVYEGVCIPGEVGYSDPYKQRLLKKLASEEEWVTLYEKYGSSSEKGKFVDTAKKFAFTHELTEDEVNSIRKVTPSTLLRSMAKSGALLPFRSFIAYATGKSMSEVNEDPNVKRAFLMELPDIFSSLMTQPSSCGDAASMFEAGSEFGSQCDVGRDDEVQQFMDLVADKFSCKTEPVKHRVLTISISLEPKAASPAAQVVTFDKAASDASLARFYAELYGHYKVAALKDMIALNETGTIDDPQFVLAVMQNRVIV